MAKGLQKPVELCDALADFMGKEKAARTEITKKVWAYIKKNDLQDPSDGRLIDFDTELSDAFEIEEGQKIHMTEIPGLISECVV